MRRRMVVALAVGLLAVGAAVAHAAVIVGTGANDTLTGTAADDSLYGADGDDALSGGAGNDDLEGGAGSDDLRGGDGADDAATYARSAGIEATLDGRPNDGPAGEADNVHQDVENVYGSPQDDTIRGSAVRNTLDGGGGDDTLTGGKGVDFLFGGPGADIIDAKDGGQDVVDCGPGNDRVISDRKDRVTDCEEAGPPKALGTVGNSWVNAGDHYELRRLEITDVSPLNATVTVRCRGGGCPFATRTVTGRTNVSFTAAFRGRELRVGAAVEVSITAPQRIGKYVRYDIVRGELPKVTRSCLRPGESKRMRCPT
jgi:hypothetical protein